MNNNEIAVSKEDKVSVTTDFSKFEIFLTDLGLPSQNIIASQDERLRMMQALPEFIKSIPLEDRKNARYLSKFIAGSAVGLFDASLNFVWNEVVLNLRNKVNAYGLDIFFDAAVGENIRDQYNCFEDLSGLKDKVLLDTCLKLELISEIIHKKLCHILDMRNNIGSSHPNTYSINSYELIGWLQNCITDVLKNEISPAAISIKSLVSNLKNRQTKFDNENIQNFENTIKDISSVMTANLLTSIFSIYVSERTESIVRENILEIAPMVWSYTKDEAKYDLGLKYDIYKSQLNEEKASLAETFFEKCDGKNYLSKGTISIKLSILCDDLEKVHFEWDNYYHEVPIIKSIMTYIKKDSDIPIERTSKLIRTISICAIGKEVNSSDGISPGAKPYYYNFFKLLNKDQVKILLNIFAENTVRNTLYGKNRQSNVKKILEIVKSSILGDRLNEIIDYLIKSKNIEVEFITKDYKDLAKGIL